VESPSDSLEIVLAYAREEYEQQRAHHAELVRRAATFLSFVTALIGLAGLDKALASEASWPLTVGVGALIVAAVLLVSVTWLRQYTTAPDSRALYEKYAERDETEVRRIVLLTTLDVIRENERPLRNLELLYQAGATFVAVGAVTIGAAIIWRALSQ
jgi:hypothetical protein